MLEHCGYTPELLPWDRLHLLTAAARGGAEEVRAAAGLPVDSQGSEERKTCSAKHGHSEKFDVNKCVQVVGTSLERLLLPDHCARSASHSGRTLCVSGNPTTVYFRGEMFNPLGIAAAHGNTKAVRELLSLGADPSIGKISSSKIIGI